MRKFFTLIGAALLVAFAAQVQAQVISTVYPDEGIDSNYVAPKVAVAPTIDGLGTDAAWADAKWKRAFYISPAIDAGGSAFSGKTDLSFEYKIVWDATSYYMLMRYIDDVVVYTPINNGYRFGTTGLPTEVTAVTGSVPAAGAGSATAGCQAFKMDQINFWLTPHTAEIENGTTQCKRGDHTVWHSFYPSVGTTATGLPAYAKLWVPKHNPLAGATTQPHEATVVATFNAAEGAYYIEFKDASWTTLFANTKLYPIVAVAPALSQKDYRTNAPAIGDKFCLGGEVNDADALTNTRDYANYIAWKTVNTSSATNKQNPNSYFTETMTITLGDIASGLSNPKANNSLAVYPNPVKGDMITLPRIADVQIFSLAGHLLLESKNSVKVNVSTLKQGVYMVKDNAGNVSKLIKE